MGMSKFTQEIKSEIAEKYKKRSGCYFVVPRIWHLQKLLIQDCQAKKETSKSASENCIYSLGYRTYEKRVDDA